MGAEGVCCLPFGACWQPRRSEHRVVLDRGRRLPDGPHIVPARGGRRAARLFPHQARDFPDIVPARPWRGAKICVATRDENNLSNTADEEPYDAEERLAFQASRAVEWVRRASLGHLPGPGEPFELPVFTMDGVGRGWRFGRVPRRSPSGKRCLSSPDWPTLCRWVPGVAAGPPSANSRARPASRWCRPSGASPLPGLVPPARRSGCGSRPCRSCHLGRRR